ncbi:MAG: hypothetical protein AAFY76_01720 [Cyanobacteria bacterium J06649_11]
MKFIIHPFEGVELEGKGLIKFGMHSSEVRQFFEEPYEVVRRGTETCIEDHWVESSIQFHYDENEVLRAAQFCPQSGNYVHFRTWELLSVPYAELITHLQNSGIALEPKQFTESLISYEFGFAVGMAYPEFNGQETLPPWIFVAEKNYPTISRENAAA